MAILFQSHGWAMRKCAFDDYEIENPFSELVIEGDQDVLMHGHINNYEVNVLKIISTLEDRQISYAIEIYENETLLREYKAQN